MSDATYEFNTDPVKAREEQVKRRQAQEAAKRGLQQELQFTTEADQIQQQITANRMRMHARSTAAMHRTMAQGQRQRLMQSIAAGGAGTGRNAPLHVEGIGPAARPEDTNYHYNPAVDAEAKAAKSGISEFVGGIKGAGAAATALAAAFTVATGALVSAAGTKKEGYSAYGDATTAVMRMARANHLNPTALLSALRASPDQAGARSFFDAMTARQQSTGQRITPAQMNAAMNAARSGGATWQSITGMAMQNQWSRIGAVQGMPGGSAEARFMDVSSGRSAALFDATVPGNRGNGDISQGENAMFYDPAWQQFKQSHPFLASLPNAEQYRYFTTAQEGRGLRESYTNPALHNRSYDQTGSSGTPQSPSVPGGVDMTSGGRSPSVDAQYIVNAIQQGGKRSPNPHRGGVEP